MRFKPILSVISKPPATEFLSTTCMNVKKRHALIHNTGDLIDPIILSDMAFIFKIKIDGSSKPPIWRKVKVNENLSFDEFHIVIQILFGWQNSHLYQYSPKGWRSSPEISYNYDDGFGMDAPFSAADTFPYGERYDAEEIKLSDYFIAPKQKIIYIYDFGDNWEHIVELLEITDDTVIYPICAGGKGSNLVEDCGGIWGFYDMVEAVNNPKHPEHKDYREWLGMKRGEKWDLNAFDLNEVNEILREVWKEKKEVQNRLNRN